MVKRKHHYVPRFYLRAFQSAERRTNTFSLSRSVAYRDASLRDQCHGHRMYGLTNEVEDALELYEQAVAPVIRSIVASGKVPPRDSAERGLLLTFIALQMLRTEAAGDRLNTFVDQFTKAAFRDDPRLGTDPDSLRIGYERPALMSLQMAPFIAEILSDLAMNAAKADRTSLITSDNPAFKYNQYCEGIRDYGVVGANCRGLQIFLPLSPDCLLTLFDGYVYKLDYRIDSPGILTTSDIRSLNLMQAIAASKTIIFSNWSQRDDVKQIANQAKRHRDIMGAHVEELIAVDNPNQSLLHGYDASPNLKLQLSYLSIRRDCRGIPLRERSLMRRKDLDLPEPPMPSIKPGTTFVRKRL